MFPGMSEHDDSTLPSGDLLADVPDDQDSLAGSDETPAPAAEATEPAASRKDRAAVNRRRSQRGLIRKVLSTAKRVDAAPKAVRAAAAELLGVADIREDLVVAILDGPGSPARAVQDVTVLRAQLGQDPIEAFSDAIAMADGTNKARFKGAWAVAHLLAGRVETMPADPVKAAKALIAVIGAAQDEGMDRLQAAIELIG